MNDLDKRLNLDLDSSSGNSEPFGKRNVNLLISLNSDDNLTGNSHAWFGIHDNSKTNSDNGSFDRSGTGQYLNRIEQQLYDFVIGYRCNVSMIGLRIAIMVFIFGLIHSLLARADMGSMISCIPSPSHISIEHRPPEISLDSGQ